MDFLKQAQGALGNMQQGQQQPQQQQQQQGAPMQQGQPGAAPVAGQATGQMDALDKGVDAVLGKLGYKQNAQMNERISDGVRSAFKSATGKDIPIADKQ